MADLSSIVKALQEAETELAARDPYLQFGGVAEDLGGMILKSQLEDPTRYSTKEKLIGGALSGLLSGIFEDVGQRRQDLAIGQYADVIGSAAAGRGIERPSRIDPRLFRKGTQIGQLARATRQAEAAESARKYREILGTELFKDRLRRGAKAEELGLSSLLEDPRMHEYKLGEIARMRGRVPSGLALRDAAPTPSYGEIDTEDYRITEPPGVPEAPYARPTRTRPDTEIDTLTDKRLRTIEQYRSMGYPREEAATLAEKDLRFETKAGETVLSELDDLYARAQRQREVADVTEAALDTGIDTGTLGGAKQIARRLGAELPSFLGGDYAERLAAAGEGIESLKGQIMGMNRVVGTGQQSDMEAKAYLQGGPGLEKTEEGNREIAARIRQISDRNMQYYDFVNETVQRGGSPIQAKNIFRQYEKENPLFFRQGDRFIRNQNIPTFNDWRAGDAREKMPERERPVLFDVEGMDTPPPTMGPPTTPTPPTGTPTPGMDFSYNEKVGDIIGGGFTNMLNALTFGGGDEFIGGVNAAIDTVLEGRSFGEAYEDRVTEARSKRETFQQAAPVGSVAQDIGSAFLMPWQAIASLGKYTPYIGSIARGKRAKTAMEAEQLATGTLNIAGQAARAGAKEATKLGDLALRRVREADKAAAALRRGETISRIASPGLGGVAVGGAYGFGEAEGGVGERLGAAVDPAAVGGVAAAAVPTFGGVLRGFQRVMQWGADDIEKALLGATRADVTRSRRYAPRGQRGEAPLTKAISKFRERGAFKGDVSEEALFNKNEDLIELFATKVDSIVDKADIAAKKSGIDPDVPNWFFARQFIRDAASGTQENLGKQLENFLGDFATKWRKSPTIQTLQKEKRALRKKAYSGLTDSKDLDKAITTDLKRYIEKNSELFLGADVGKEVRGLNRVIGEHLELSGVLQRNKDASEAGSKIARLMRRFTLSPVGGSVLGITSAAATGNPVYAVLGILAAGATSRSGSAIMAKGFRRAGDAALKVPQGLKLPGAAVMGGGVARDIAKEERGNIPQEIAFNRQESEAVLPEFASNVSEEVRAELVAAFEDVDEGITLDELLPVLSPNAQDVVLEAIKSLE